MVKYALLIGVNYLNDEVYELKASHNDVGLIHKFLIDHQDFLEENIVTLTDKENVSESLTATYDNIKNKINEMIEVSDENDLLFFYFTGHGSQVPDMNFDETDKKDEVFVPSDYNEHIFVDDELNRLFSKSDSTIFSMFDCCNSGTMSDLKYTYTISPFTLHNKLTKKDEKKMVSISSCFDNQESYEKQYSFAVEDASGNETSTFEKKWFSDFTYHFVKHLTDNNETFLSLMKTFTSKKVLKNSVFSYSNANITKSDVFNIHEPIVDITSTENDKNNDNNLVDRYNRLNKNLKKMKKDMKNKDLLIQKFRKFLNVENTPYHPFNEIVYSLR